MSLSAIDVTVVLISPDLGRFLHPSVKSVEAAINRAQSELKLKTEWIVAADSPSSKSEDYFNCHLPLRTCKLIAREGTTAATLNQAVSQAEGKFVAIVDGHDLVSSNWLVEAYRQGANQSAKAVYHPGMIIFYGEQDSVFITPDQEHPDFTADIVFARNLWPSTTFALREIFLGHPYAQPGKERGFDHLYWHWNCELMAAGILHKPIKYTFSCCSASDVHICIYPENEKTQLMMPSRFFELVHREHGDDE